MTKFLRMFARPSTKQLVCAGLFTLALAGSVSLGIASHQKSGAAVIRDTNQANSIDNSSAGGGIGAADPTEFINDINSGNPSDLKTIYASFGLNPSDYQNFLANAKMGMANKDGTVVVDGQTVMTETWSIGRTPFSYSTPITIGGKTYYKSMDNRVLRQDLPVMVIFNDDGSVKFAVMNACGNTVEGNHVKPDAVCNALQATQPDVTHKPNTYTFTTDAGFSGNASLSRVVYNFGDGSAPVEKTSLTDGVEHTFIKDSDVTVTVFAKVPGGKEVIARVINCKKHITYVHPFFVCSNLLAVAIDQQKKSFRFTVLVKTDTTGQTTLKDVDFILDGKTTTSGVTTKDNDGNVYKEYTFTDEVKHNIKASVNFNTAEGVQSDACEADVTPQKTPKCTVKGHENEAPNSPTCGYCQPNIPIGDVRCTPPTPQPPTPPTLVNTGPGSTIGLFAATVIAGFIGHKIFLSRRNRRETVELTPVL